MAVVVVNEIEFRVVNFGRPLEGLGDVAGSGDRAEGRVGVRRSDVAGGAEDFADVFREVVAVGEPVAVLLDRERARRGRLRRIPGDEPQSRMRRTRQIKRRNLQIAAINVAVMQRRYSRNRHFLFEATALRVVEEAQPRILRAVRHGFVFRAALLSLKVHSFIFRSVYSIARSCITIGSSPDFIGFTKFLRVSMYSRYSSTQRE